MTIGIKTLLCAVFCAFSFRGDKLSVRHGTCCQGSYRLIEKTTLIHMEPKENHARWLMQIQMVWLRCEKRRKYISPRGVRRGFLEYSALKDSPAVRRLAWREVATGHFPDGRVPSPEVLIASSEDGDELAPLLKVIVKIIQDDVLSTVPATQ